MKDKPKDEPKDEQHFESTDNMPDLFTLIDWVFFAGAPIGEPDEPESELEETTEESSELED